MRVLKSQHMCMGEGACLRLQMAVCVHVACECARGLCAVATHAHTHTRRHRHRHRHTHTHNGKPLSSCASYLVLSFAEWRGEWLSAVARATEDRKFKFLQRAFSYRASYPLPMAFSCRSFQSFPQHGCLLSTMEDLTHSNGNKVYSI